MKELLNTLRILLFWDQSKNQYSHTKFWSNIGYACMCYTFVYAVMYGSSVDVMVWLIFGIVVVGNRTLVKFISKGNNNESTK